MAEDITLETRLALPDALRVLVTAYPRDSWESHSEFHGLISFWLERHMMFRKLMANMQSDAQAAADRKIDPKTYANRLSRFGGMFVNELHGHHQIEDHHYFPVLSRTEPTIARGFEILDKDHHAIDGHLNTFVRGANAILSRLSDPIAFGSSIGRFNDDLTRLEGFLDRHLLDEEELVVPVILKHGSGALS